MTVNRRAVLSVLFAAFMVMVLVGCSNEQPVGPVVNEADLLYMSPEIPAGEEGIGIVYRRIQNFDSFLAKAGSPVLILVSSYGTPLDQAATLLLEQLAYEYRGQAMCIRVEADEHPEIASFCDAGTLPCFAVVEKGALRNTTGGLVTVNRETIVAMLAVET